jgi:chromosomal replication initiator protein
LQEQWACVQKSLSAELGQATYNTWFKQVAFCNYNSGAGVLHVGVPTRFVKDWIDRHYASVLRQCVKQTWQDVENIQIVVDDSLVKKQQAKDIAYTGDFTTTSKIASPTPLRDNISLDPRFTFNDFVVGQANEFAYRACMKIADTVQGCSSGQQSRHNPFNPLFLYSSVGLGKSHLMHAIAWEIDRRSPQGGKNVIYLPAERFMFHFIKSLKNDSIMAFKDSLRQADLLMIDDIHFLAGKTSTQEEFFHAFNSLVEDGKQVVISADRSPSDLSGIEDRLKSRLGWGVIADIHPPTFELRLAILYAKAEQLGHEIRADVLSFLAEKLGSNIRELEGALNRLVAQSTLMGVEITIELTQRCLKDLLKSTPNVITVEQIQQLIAAHHEVSVHDLVSARRSRGIVIPRQVAMYLSKMHTRCSLPEIGRHFGKRDHTTVMHAVKQVEKKMCEDVEFCKNIKFLEQQLS